MKRFKKALRSIFPNWLLLILILILLIVAMILDPKVSYDKVKKILNGKIDLKQSRSLSLLTYPKKILINIRMQDVVYFSLTWAMTLAQ